MPWWIYLGPAWADAPHLQHALTEERHIIVAL